ncbi:pkd domain containing protein [Colletotrichum truncatum]|uniref:Pkd domain containing protein n=1 Tax=Colletotrichum truncatum TaxID=5467 RepID=A0ACC3Z880_COLTU|nr:pkd domain containing protein [Colletotrichum truncatum]KAF6789112.1 pkd domain containing protein [Colletotrichum truncatum]
MGMSAVPKTSTLVTPESIDAVYKYPIIDAESDQSSPAKHHRVSGHFENTPIRFNFYFPPRDRWDGRFFQLTFPTQHENATDEVIGFALDSHAYAVQATGSRGFQAEAAAAQFSRVVARRYYGSCSRRIYGYLYGGSGGSLQVIGAVENSIGIWDGAVPSVQAIPISAPNNPSIRAMASLVLRNSAEQIQDALRPGGTGDPFSILNPVEREMLQEATNLGVPIQAWEDFSEVSDASTLSLLSNVAVKILDPTYVDDFWFKKGYLGTDPSPLGEVLRTAVVSFVSTVRHVKVDSREVPFSVELDVALSPGTFMDEYWYDFTVSTADGVELGVLVGTFNYMTKVAVFNNKRVGKNDILLLRKLAQGIKLRVENRRSIAMRAYYRYQVPERRGFYGFDHLRNPDGSSRFPRRLVDVSKCLSEGALGGATHTGDIKVKIIVVQNLMDSGAFPWHADWYKKQVKQALGCRFEDNYRLWFNENTEHEWEGPSKKRASLIVPYRGIVQQALRDMSAWVERGVPPPASTSYSVAEDSSIILPPAADDRRGIQPTVHLTVEGGKKFEAKIGQTITFHATITAPPGAGAIVYVEWDFFGKGRYTYGHLSTPKQTVEVQTTFTYNTPGNFIVGIRATLQREGNVVSKYAGVMNLARVSVTVGKSTDLGKEFRL